MTQAGDHSLDHGLDHKAALATLPAALRSTLTERQNRAGLLHLAGHLGAILGISLAIAAKVPLWPLLLLPQGVLLVFLFTLEHECTHQTPFRSPWLNELVGHVCGLLLFLPFTWFRYFHLAHHRHTNHPERDPELAGGRPQTWPAYLRYLSGWGYWSGMAGVLWQNALGRADAPYLPDRALPRMRLEARAMLAAYGMAVASLFYAPLLFWLWLLPILLGQPVLRLYLLAEHGRCPPVANMLENTRTTFTNRAVRFIAWNMPYHAEHHAWPQVPFHKLPTLHAELAPHLKSTSPSYSDFTRNYASHLK